MRWRHSVKLAETGKGYAWYDFGGVFTPNAGDDFDIRPGELMGAWALAVRHLHPTKIRGLDK